MKKQQSPITESQKEIIIKSYEMGISPTIISKQIGKSATSISSFFSRWKLNKTLPPKIKLRKSAIDGRMGLLIKKQVSETPRASLKKLASKLKEIVGDNS